MKNLLKNTWLFTLCAMLLLTSCSKDDENSKPKNVAPEIKAQSFNATENASDTDVLGKVEATDKNTEDKLTFSITANDNDLFQITSTGNLSLASGKRLDFETVKSHSITVQVSDGKLQSTATITIVVIDADENVAPTIAAQSFTAAEDITQAIKIGDVTATDPEGASLTYSITTNDNGLFEITSAGALSLVTDKNLDFESKKSHTITVTVNDGTLTASGTITINVTNVNEKPRFPDRNYTFTKPENINDAVVIATVTATDPDGDALTYTLNNNPGNIFEINSNSGQISLNRHRMLDYESATSHTITVQASDGHLAGLQHGVTIKVTNIVDRNVSTLAGSSFGFANGTGTAAKFYFPQGMAIDAVGNIYVADQSNHRIRKVTPAGVVSTFAGSGVRGFANGHRASAQFNFPTGVTIDASGNMYVADSRNYRIRKITPSGVVSTFAGTGARGYADGPGASARFASPQGMTVDASGNIYVVDSDAHRIRKITPSGVVSTFAGSRYAGSNDGTGTSARFRNPIGIAIDGSGNLYVADARNHRIRKITPSGVVSTFAGSNAGFADGTGAGAKFNSPQGVAVDAAGNVYVADDHNHRIRKITPAGVVTTFAGGAGGATNGLSTVARFNRPVDVVVDGSGNLYVADFSNHRIRKVFTQ